MFRRFSITNICNCPWQKLRWYSANTIPKTFQERKQLYGDLFPDKLLTKKHRTPDVLYMANEEAASVINKHLDGFFKQSPCDTILEMNPGIGMFTRKLLDREEQFKKILLMEGMECFMNNLQELHSLYPERVKVKNSDLTYVWKQMYQDRIDNGSRVTELLRDVPKKTNTEEPNMIIFGAVGSLQFFQHLINSIVFQNGFLSLGRTEMYFVMPPPLYVHLTCSSEIGYLIYRASSILFQILFEYRFITRLPRGYFLPTQTEYNDSKKSKLRRLNSINPEYLYLVRMIPRSNILDFLPLEDLPALWYFIKQNYVSRRNRIIPNLEKWIPGCGPRLIINSNDIKTAKPLYPDENVSELPKYSSQCSTISNRDIFPNMNIYTQFGDLKPSQIFALFTIFRNWPEYRESTFLASYENSMLNLTTSAEDISYEDEMSADLSALDEKTETASPDPPPIKRPRKTKTNTQT